MLELAGWRHGIATFGEMEGGRNGPGTGAARPPHSGERLGEVGREIRLWKGIGIGAGAAEGGSGMEGTRQRGSAGSTR